MKVELNNANIVKIKQYLEQQKQLQGMLNDVISTILDTKEIDYKGKSISISEDISSIILTDIKN